MKEFEKWFKKAESDLLTIQNNLNSENIPSDVCCFHAQQAVEKYFKGYLVSRNISFPKTHDLDYLLNLCKQSNEAFEETRSLIKKLTEYSITPRYPDMLDDLTVEDAQQAYQNAGSIKEFILKHFFE